jgi:pseudouridine kinase
MSLAAQRRDLLQKFTCVICNQQEAGLLFVEEYDDFTPDQMLEELKEKVVAANFKNMVVTMGGQGAVFASSDGAGGYCPAKNVQVKDTTGAGDAFCAGVAIGMTYGDGMAHACEIGSTLAASVITSSENVCPRFLPAELGLDVDVE